MKVLNWLNECFRIRTVLIEMYFVFVLADSVIILWVETCSSIITVVIIIGLEMIVDFIMIVRKIFFMIWLIVK